MEQAVGLSLRRADPHGPGTTGIDVDLKYSPTCRIIRNERKAEKMNNKGMVYIDSPLGQTRADSEGSPIGVTRMDVNRSYAGVGQLLELWRLPGGY